MADRWSAWTRRGFIGASLGGIAACASPAGAALPPTDLPETRSIALRHLHTGEKLQATYASAGQYVPAVLRDIDHVLRDWRTGDVMAIDPRLLDILTRLSIKLDTHHAFEVICGYRSPKTNAMLRAHGHGGVAVKSLHLVGQAIDIRLPGRPLTALRNAALDLQLGGVGYYPDQDFVHVDTGPVRAW